jgi:ribosomal protein S18 acetylase RimI-like enzyme
MWPPLQEGESPLIDIRQLKTVNQDMLNQIVPGYTSGQSYTIETTSSRSQVAFILRSKQLKVPFVKRHDYSNPSVLTHYNEVAARGRSYGAYSGDQCVGLVLAELQEWNSTYVVRELGVQPDLRRRGIGQNMMARILEDATSSGARCVMCETQSSNVPAIEFYMQLGFAIEGIDLSYYCNNDMQREEIAVFLRKKF